MSIVEIKKTGAVGGGALIKAIHKGSESIMFDVLQNSQYMYPVKSAVREVVSNALDSIVERDNAKKIFAGEIKVEDLYIHKEGEEYKDSGFKRDYYDLKWLSDKPNVRIEYIENDTQSRDRIKIIDNGVGLGGSRLVNSCNLGFSSKRLNTSLVGSYGLGSKSFLSTGVDSYIVTSHYNGRKYKLEIYKDHVVSLIDKFADDGGLNEIETFYNGFTCYYEKTDKLNSVTFEAEVKRFKNKEYSSAVESQLQYIDNIKYVVIDKQYDNGEVTKELSSKILYQNDKVIVGENDYWAVPQILLKPGKDSKNYINYGKIAFDELEMKDYKGNVAFIVDINRVDVTPSRENVIWNEKTRGVIKQCFLDAQQVVIDTLQDKLSEVSNIIEYAALSLSLRNGAGSIDGFGELVRIIDISEIDTTYKGVKSYKFGVNFNKNNDIKFVTSEISGYGQNTKLKPIDYGLDFYSLGFLATFYNSISRTKAHNDCFIFVSTTKFKQVVPYARKKLDLTTSRQINMVWITPDLWDISQSMKDKTTAAETFIKEERYVHAVVSDLRTFAEAENIPILYEAEVDKAKMKESSEKNEAATSSRYETEAQLAKKENKVMCLRHHSFSYGNQSYWNEASFKSRSGTIVLYARNDDTIVELIRSSYNSVPGQYTLLGCSSEGLARFSKLNNTKSFREMCYTIKYGDITLTHFGRQLFGNDQDKMIRIFNLGKYFQNKASVSDSIIQDSIDQASKKERLQYDGATE